VEELAKTVGIADRDNIFTVLIEALV